MEIRELWRFAMANLRLESKMALVIGVTPEYCALNHILKQKVAYHVSITYRVVSCSGTVRYDVA